MNDFDILKIIAKKLCIKINSMNYDEYDNIMILYLTYNQLSGLPAEIGNLQNLTDWNSTKSKYTFLLPQSEFDEVEIHLYINTIGIRRSRNTPLYKYYWNSTKSKQVCPECFKNMQK